jgi:hypothetical protein
MADGRSAGIFSARRPSPKDTALIAESTESGCLLGVLGSGDAPPVLCVQSQYGLMSVHQRQGPASEPGGT